ncbi:MAG: glycosyltransferase family 2 protein [Desulfobacteraceae bacterium]|nr:glycosyltransferase family 2 protein [Desulfobacteraceae bacterium]
MNQELSEISATIITKDEEANIADCINSLSWANEVVVLDSGSKDNTVSIARQYTDKVFVEQWRGQGRQKNRAAELAKGPWIVSIDADERVSPELAREILKHIKEDNHAAMAMRRKNFYKGQWIRHCGWWPDWVIRVFRKGESHFSTDVIHDSLQVKANIIKLTHPLIHYSFHSPEDFLNRAYWYAYHQSREMYRKGEKATVWTAVSHAVFNFLQTFFLRFGFMDGAAGLLVAVSNFVGVFYRYMMLRDLNNRKSQGDER